MVAALHVPVDLVDSQYEWGTQRSPAGFHALLNFAPVQGVETLLLVRLGCRVPLATA